MTNVELITNWESLGILLDDDAKLIKLKDCFMNCEGETHSEYEFANGSKHNVVGFVTSGRMGSSLWCCHSDDDDNCWEMYFATKDFKKPSTRKKGRFVKL